MGLKFCEKENCNDVVDTDGLHVIVELEIDVYFHANCFLESEWYDPADIVGKSIINAEQDIN